MGIIPINPQFPVFSDQQMLLKHVLLQNQKLKTDSQLLISVNIRSIRAYPCAISFLT
jgi:hypothetical protein